ncbi:MAG: tryptophan synthase subunit beta [Armatimonadetes bacterium]|nr:tryptophan synthase subunit beta [Armatimonadota bacterium]
MAATKSWPDASGKFGAFGGRFVPETLMTPLAELERVWGEARADDAFWAELMALLHDWSGRPTPTSFAPRLTGRCGGARIYLKREDLNHTGSHKLNNCLGQALLAMRMGKKRIIAETGAGQHGVATATVCAHFGLDCIVYMGVEDMRRQAHNVFRMELLGAKVVPVHSGTQTLKDATNEALRDWVANVESTHYILGSVVGPHPYPSMVRDFQAVIGVEARQQIERLAGRQPSAVLACVGGGSNAMGMFYAFLPDACIRLIGVEAGGTDNAPGHHAASLTEGQPGVLHGAHTYLLQDADGQVIDTHSISAGLDYPGVGPEHAFLKDLGRVEYVCVRDDEALIAFQQLSRIEGILPALEPSHALAHAMRMARDMSVDDVLLVCLSGRGDKDLEEVKARLS